jgi:hypothetical protein
MKTETKEVYKCDFCKKMYQRKNACANHEVSCSKNPENNRACFGCPHLVKKTTQIYIDGYDGFETEQDIELLFCEAKDIFLYPPKVEIKKNSYDLGDDLNEPMPKECEIEENFFVRLNDNNLF